MLLPSNALTIDELQTKEQPSLTYKMMMLGDEARVIGKIDNLEAIQQAVSKCLATEKNAFEIYRNSGYGINVEDLINKPYDLVASELQRRIKEALLKDNRIEQVSNFQFSRGFDYLTVTFEVHCYANGKFNSSRDFNV